MLKTSTITEKHRNGKYFFYCKGTVPINFASGLSLSNFQYDADEFILCPTKKSVPTAEEEDAIKESSKSSEGKENDDSKEVSPIDEGSNSMYIYSHARLGKANNALETILTGNFINALK